MPDFIWLGAGSLNNLKPQRFFPFKHRKIAVFPDLNCFAKWKKVCNQIEIAIDNQIIVSDFLEIRASKKDIKAGYDLADFLVKKDTSNSGWAVSDEGYPLFWDL